MKIAITGHSRGLGAQLKTYYEKQGHTVSGFSRANGYDLRNWEVMHKMLGQIQDHDMFISVAKPDFVQTTVLYELWKLWRDQSKTIINIGSSLTACPTLPKPLFQDPGMDAYRTAKLSLQEASQQLAFKSIWPNIILVNPQHLYGNPMTQQEKIKLATWVETFGHISELIHANGFQLKQISF